MDSTSKQHKPNQEELSLQIGTFRATSKNPLQTIDDSFEKGEPIALCTFSSITYLPPEWEEHSSDIAKSYSRDSNIRVMAQKKDEKVVFYLDGNDSLGELIQKSKEAQLTSYAELKQFLEFQNFKIIALPDPDKKNQDEKLKNILYSAYTYSGYIIPDMNFPEKKVPINVPIVEEIKPPIQAFFDAMNKERVFVAQMNLNIETIEPSKLQATLMKEVKSFLTNNLDVQKQKNKFYLSLKIEREKELKNTSKQAEDLYTFGPTYVPQENFEKDKKPNQVHDHNKINNETNSDPSRKRKHS